MSAVVRHRARGSRTTRSSVCAVRSPCARRRSRAARAPAGGVALASHPPACAPRSWRVRRRPPR
eukprot:6565764-Prymnesium_polylepis.1